MDYDESTSNVSPGRGRRIVAAPPMAVGRRELLRCNYRRSDIGPVASNVRNSSENYRSTQKLDALLSSFDGRFCRF
jgi:hypothetical protein